MTAAVFLKDHLRPALLTVIMVAIGALCAYYLWQTYLTAPWTRDGRLRAEIAEIVSGWVTPSIGDDLNPLIPWSCCW